MRHHRNTLSAHQRLKCSRTRVRPHARTSGTEGYLVLIRQEPTNLVQRTDALQHIEIIHDQIPRHDDLKAFLANTVVLWDDLTPQRTGRITLNDMYQYGELSDFEPLSDLWAGNQYIPKTRVNNQDATGNENHYIEMGPFDRDSVMLYASNPWDRMSPILLYRNPRERICKEIDFAAIHAKYCD